MRIKVDEMADMVGHVKNIERGFCTENSLECMKTRGGLIEQKRDHYNRLFMTNNVKPKYKQCPKS